MKKITILFLMSWCSVLSAENINIYNLLDKADKLYRGKTSYVEIDMTIKTEHWERTLSLKSWGQGLEKTFITILAPKKDRGISTLKIKNAMWNFFPKINKVIKVPTSMMMGSWMGSDFTNDDFVKETTLKDDYHSRIIPSDNKGIYIIELKPKKDTVSIWGKIILYLQKKTLILEKQEFYDEGEKLARTMEFLDIQWMGGRRIPTKLIVKPVNKKNRSTVLKYKKAEFNIPIKNSIFTRQNLQKRR